MRHPVLASFSETTGISSIPTNAWTVRSASDLEQRCSLYREQHQQYGRHHGGQLPIAGAPAYE